MKREIAAIRRRVAAVRDDRALATGDGDRGPKLEILIHDDDLAPGETRIEVGAAGAHLSIISVGEPS
ncbi:MAG: hypothetical protein HQL40_20990 [Alphaproteobacteria bacterium]|nr:hypothetical protein [Alphaproteobacteria bacterium]